MLKVTLYNVLKAREGFVHLMGVDYSQAAINLAKSVVCSHGYDFIQFKVKIVSINFSLLCQNVKN